MPKNTPKKEWWHDDPPTDKQLNYLNKIVSQLPSWNYPKPKTKVEAAEQIDEAKHQWQSEMIGYAGEIY